jgi:biopolymer transport protein ExbB/TolQ
MPLTPSQRPIREWPLLILTLIVVGLVCYPFVQLVTVDQAPTWSSWTQERWARLLLGPEQVACYCCFTWGLLIFFRRYREMQRQRRAFRLGMLPTDEGARILQEDARPLQRALDQITQTNGPFILANMIRAGLAKFALSRSSQDVRETLRTQAEVDLGRLVSSMATLNYLAWAIPAVGFFGTVRGLAGSMTLAEQGGRQLSIATQHLTVAFDCTLVALALSLVVMFLIHTLQREEESLMFDCQQYCLEHLVNRLYEPEMSASGHALKAHGEGAPGTITGSFPERVGR